MKEFFKNFLSLSEPLSFVFVVILLVLMFLIYILKDIGFGKRMLISVLLGCLLGFIIEYLGSFPPGNVAEFSGELLWMSEVYRWYDFLSYIFSSLLKLMVVPIVFIGISASLIQIYKNIHINKIFISVVFWLVFMSVLASFIGVMLGDIFGVGLNLHTKPVQAFKSFDDILHALIPNNIIKTMSDDNIFGVMIISCMMTFAAKSFSNDDMFESFCNMILFLNKVILKMVANLILLMPYAVLVMIVSVIMKNGIWCIKDALFFMMILYLSAMFVFVIHGIVLLLHGVNPLKHFYKALPMILLAFTSRSSSAILPYTAKTLESMGVSLKNANFISSIGATIGMNGSSGYYAGLVGVFLLHSVGFSVGISDIVLILVITFIASFSIAGAPSIAIVVAFIMATGLGFGDKFYLLGIIVAIDPILDMIRTASNVSGVLVAGVCAGREKNDI